MHDTDYLKTSVGGALSKGLAAVAVEQPDDPVDYLGNWLLKYLQREKIEKEVEAAKSVFASAQQEAAKAAAEEETKKNAAVADKAASTSVVRDAEKVPRMWANFIRVMQEQTNAANVYISVLEKPPPVFDEEGNEIPPEEEEPEPEPEPEEEQEEEAAEEEGEEQLDEDGNPIPKPEKPVKEKPPPRIPKSHHLRIINANEGNAHLVGKFLNRKQGVVTFQAVDSRGQVLVSNVFDSPQPIYFHDMPMPGSYAAKALIDSNRAVVGCVHVDTVGDVDDRRLGESDAAFLEQAMADLSLAYDRLVTQVFEQRSQEKATCKSLEDTIKVSDEEAVGDEDAPDVIDEKIAIGASSRLAGIVGSLDEHVTPEVLTTAMNPDPEDGPVDPEFVKLMTAFVVLVRGTKEATLQDLDETNLEAVKNTLGDAGDFLTQLKAIDIKGVRVKKSYARARELIGETTAEQAANISLVTGVLFLVSQCLLELSDKNLIARTKEAEAIEDELERPILEEDVEEDERRAAIQQERDEAERKRAEEEAAAAAAEAEGDAAEGEGEGEGDE